MNIGLGIRELGVSAEMDNSTKRYVVISNILSIIIAAFTIVVGIAGVSFFGTISSVKLAFVFALIFSFPLLFNQLGYTNASRLFLSLVVSAASVLLSIVDKLDYQLLEEFQYFEFRLMLICAGLVPFIVFKLSEKKYLFLSLLFNILCLLLYDPIHNFFNVGYYQLGFIGPNYSFLNFMVLACFSIMVGGSYFLKASYEGYENDNETLIQKLSDQAKEVVDTNVLISEQRAILAKENTQLNKELIEKNNQLVLTNDQLIQHNNDLQQFSYTVSHNLRGPVASLLGIANLVDENELNEQNKTLFRHLQKSVVTLDATIKDLGNIIDIRNAISKVKQRIHLQAEVDQVLILLQNEINQHQIEVLTDVQVSEAIYSVKAMVNSILYNLISNAIKYRSTDRESMISITAYKKNQLIVIEVSDNGLGIDLAQNKEKLFGLYKRFHTHVDGKGLGLFLVKLQAESLGGKVEIESKEGAGSTFRVWISNAADPGHQVIMDKEWGQLYFDAPRNTGVVVWKRALLVDEFQDFFHRCKEFGNAQQCPNWIVEIRQGTKAEKKDEEYDRVRMQFANEMKRTSLKRMGYVIAPANEPPNFEHYKEQLTAFYQGRIKFFETLDEAQQWIQDEVNAEMELTEKRTV